MGALFLASKLEECFVRMTHLITVYDLVIRKMKGQSIQVPLDAFSQVKEGVPIHIFFFSEADLIKHSPYSVLIT
jgi:hypothetical protein